MECKIWMRFIQIAQYRHDLIDVIKPFFVQLKNGNNPEKLYNINDEKFNLFLGSLFNFQIKLLYKHGIISEEKYKTFIREQESSKCLKLYQEIIYGKTIDEILKGDNVQELQKFINEKGKNALKPIKKSFNEVRLIAIPVIIECIIQNAIKCFKYLLINDIDDPKDTMQEQNVELHYDLSHRSWIPFPKYEWDSIAIAIYYGNFENI